MRKGFWKELFRPENKKLRGNVFLALLLGVALLVAGKGFSGGGTDTAEAEPSVQAEALSLRQAERQTERRMAELLAQVAGAGEVDVMLTYRRTEEKTVAQTETREESRSEEAGKTEESLRLETGVVLTEDGRGNTAPLILSAAAPQTEGAVIVAQGGDDPSVRAALTEAAQALLDVPAHKIAVLKMK